MGWLICCLGVLVDETGTQGLGEVCGIRSKNCSCVVSFAACYHCVAPRSRTAKVVRFSHPEENAPASP